MASVEFSRERKEKIWKSREIILEIMKDRKYKPSDDNPSVSFQEFLDWVGEDCEDVVFTEMQMIFQKEKGLIQKERGLIQKEKGLIQKEKCLKKVEKTMIQWIPKASLQELGDAVSKAKDSGCNTMILVTNNHLKHPARNFLTKLVKMGIIVHSYTIDELQYNIMKHMWQPEFKVLTKKETRALLETYNIKKEVLPKILSTDVVVRHFAAKSGSILRIKRKSYTQPGYYAIAYKVVS
jgi:DNA-directed RNA polymerases I, II, and III subunit RPABC1